MNQQSQKDVMSAVAGSPLPGEPVFLVVGKIRRPFGLKGELLMEVHTDFPERLEAGLTVFVGDDQTLFKLKRTRWHSRLLLVAFEGVNDPDAAAVFRNQYVYVKTIERPQLQDGEYYHHQLLGINVVLEDNRILGKLIDILETGANDVYVVLSPEGKEILLPAIEPVILNIDLNRKNMLVRLLPGLLSD